VSKALASAATVAAVERLARADRRMAATASQFDADPWLLNTPDGVVDLRTGETRDPQREDFMTKMTSASLGGSCERWMAFLNTVTGGDLWLRHYLARVGEVAVPWAWRSRIANCKATTDDENKEGNQ
jgi:putative DNA primase/helicase